MKSRKPEPAEIHCGQMRFLITDRPSDGTMDKYVEVSSSHFPTASWRSQGRQNVSRRALFFFGSHRYKRAEYCRHHHCHDRIAIPLSPLIACDVTWAASMMISALVGLFCFFFCRFVCALRRASYFVGFPFHSIRGCALSNVAPFPRTQASSTPLTNMSSPHLACNEWLGNDDLCSQIALLTFQFDRSVKTGWEACFVCSVVAIGTFALVNSLWKNFDGPGAKMKLLLWRHSSLVNWSLPSFLLSRVCR